MSEPMDEDMTSDSGEGVFTPDTDEIEMNSKNESWRDIVKVFQTDFERLPTKVQEKYMPSKQAGQYFVLKQHVDDFLRDHVLDDFIEKSSENFRQALIDVFGDKHPYLNDVLATQRAQGSGIDHGYNRSLSSILRVPSFTGPFKPRPKPAVKPGVEEVVGEEMDVDNEDEDTEQGAALSRVIRAISSTTTTTVEAPRQGILNLRLSSTDINPSPFTTAETPTPAQTAREAEAQERQKPPVIPGFTISTRSRPVGSTSGAPAVEDPAAPEDNPHPRHLRDAENESWLRNWMQQRGFSTANDLILHPYKGWKIEAPKIQLIRAKNFLSDEDIDRTVDWARKFAELAEYFAYLLHNYNGEDWGYDLREAIDMLHTHWVFESYHYGRPTLNLDFPNVLPTHSKRLPPGPGPAIRMEPRGPSDLGKRDLLHRELEKAHDGQYGMPSKILRKHYLKEYDFDAIEFFADSQTVQPHSKRSKDPSVPEEDKTFNMVRAEDAAYNYCMDGGTDATAEYLFGPGNFQFSSGDIVKDTDGKEHAKLESLKSFANFRGARRAALQLCLNTFDNSENKSVKTPWRALILPTPSATNKPGAGIFFQPEPVKDVPEKAARDPFAYTVGLRRLQRRSEHWAQWVRKHAVKEAYGHKLWMGRNEPPMGVPPNFLGPYDMHYMDIGIKKLYDLKIRCEGLLDRLKRAAQNYPRDLIYEVIRYAGEAFDGEGYRATGLRFRPSEIQESQNTVLPLRPKEEEWLQYLCKEPVNKFAHGRAPGGERDPLSVIFEDRVQAMKNDADPEAFFNTHNLEDRWLGKFLEALNSCAGGNKKAKKHQFTIKEARTEVFKCCEAGVLGFRLAVPFEKRPMKAGDCCVVLPDDGLEPERLVTWNFRKPETVDMDGGDADLTQSRYYRELLRRNQEEEERQVDEDAVSETGTLSTKVSVPDTEKDLGPYHLDMPEMEKLRSSSDYEQLKDASHREQPDVENFFMCLGYRLGLTLRELGNFDANIDEHLTPEQKKLNQEFVEEILSYWQGDAVRRPNDPKINKDLDGTDSVTPHYRDIIKDAEPENFDEKWGQWHYDDDVETTSEIVRKKVLEELHRNQSTLFPKRVIKDEASAMPDPRMSRDPIWSFAHPGRKMRVKKFWDINRWPLHLQSEETQPEIRKSGPKERKDEVPASPVVYFQVSPEGKEILVFEGTGDGSPRLTETIPQDPTEDIDVIEDESMSEVALPPPQMAPESQEAPQPREAPRPRGARVTFAEPPTEHEAPPAAEPAERAAQGTLDTESGRREMVDDPAYAIPYWRHDLDRRRFDPNAREFWGGDTPLQRKAIEDYFKRGLETTKPETWRDRLSGAIFGKPKEVDPHALPEVDPRYIPKSRPRIPSPQLEPEDPPVMAPIVQAEEEDAVMQEVPAPVARATRAPADVNPAQTSGAGTSDPGRLLYREPEVAEDEEDDLYDP